MLCCNNLYEQPLREQTQRAVPLMERILCFEIFLFCIRTREKFHCHAVSVNRGGLTSAVNHVIMLRNTAQLMYNINAFE